MDIKRAKEIANATEWHGDMVVNFMTAHKAAKRLADALEDVQAVLYEETGITIKENEYDS